MGKPPFNAGSAQVHPGCNRSGTALPLGFFRLLLPGDFKDHVRIRKMGASQAIPPGQFFGAEKLIIFVRRLRRAAVKKHPAPAAQAKARTKWHPGQKPVLKKVAGQGCCRIRVYFPAGIVL